MNIVYDLILIGIIGAMFVSLYSAAWLVHRAWTRPTKGNPFRKFKDWQVASFLK
ncbi:MAG: hypothetical protein ACOYB3_01255 [Azonexus sp.]